MVDMCESEAMKRDTARHGKISRINEMLERAAFLNKRIESIDKRRRLLCYDQCCNMRGAMREPERISDNFLDAYVMESTHAVDRMFKVLAEIEPTKLSIDGTA